MNISCTSLGYYSQSISGQLEVVQKSTDINKLINDKNTPINIRNRLKTIIEIRNFSIDQLGLPDNDSYFSYADLEREYVVWNIFAAEEFSLQPQQWCFLFVGCLQYRGYFSEDSARDFAKTLEDKGMETYVGGVSAYSTLGWFDDPVLNTMLKWSDARLAAVIFHELTHQLFYIKGDTEFNESLADAVAIIGVKRWLVSSARKGLLKEYNDFLSREEEFVNLILKYKEKLEVLYSTNLPDQIKRDRKKELFNGIREEYKIIKLNWQKDYYGNWIKTRLNNASIASVVSYRKYLPAFLNMFEASQENIDIFFNKIRILTQCSLAERQMILNKKLVEFSCLK
ncbi:MAG: aminopeptidase [Proteobacteria bacterium]|nr:aminopeptidase [Pseudomonadota bacterium]